MKKKTRKHKEPAGTKLLESIFTADERELLGSTFRRMDIAEDEIARAKQTHPLHAAKLHDAFRALCPTTPLRSISHTIYRNHCRELLERIVTNADLKPGTDAEILSILSEASLVAPPTRTAAVLYWRLFRRILPAQALRV